MQGPLTSLDAMRKVGKQGMASANDAPNKYGGFNGSSDKLTLGAQEEHRGINGQLYGHGDVVVSDQTPASLSAGSFASTAGVLSGVSPRIQPFNFRKLGSHYGTEVQLDERMRGETLLNGSASAHPLSARIAAPSPHSLHMRPEMKSSLDPSRGQDGSAKQYRGDRMPALDLREPDLDKWKAAIEEEIQVLMQQGPLDQRPSRSRSSTMDLKTDALQKRCSEETSLNEQMLETFNMQGDSSKNSWQSNLRQQPDMAYSRPPAIADERSVAEPKIEFESQGAVDDSGLPNTATSQLADDAFFIDDFIKNKRWANVPRSSNGDDSFLSDYASMLDPKDSVSMVDSAVFAESDSQLTADTGTERWANLPRSTHGNEGSLLDSVMAPASDAALDKSTASNSASDLVEEPIYGFEPKKLPKSLWCSLRGMNPDLSGGGPDKNQVPQTRSMIDDRPIKGSCSKQQIDAETTDSSTLGLRSKRSCSKQQIDAEITDSSMSGLRSKRINPDDRPITGTGSKQASEIEADSSADHTDQWMSGLRSSEFDKDVLDDPFVFGQGFKPKPKLTEKRKYKLAEDHSSKDRGGISDCMSRPQGAPHQMKPSDEADTGSECPQLDPETVSWMAGLRGSHEDNSSHSDPMIFGSGFKNRKPPTKRPSASGRSSGSVDDLNGSRGSQSPDGFCSTSPYSRMQYPNGFVPPPYSSKAPKPQAKSESKHVPSKHQAPQPSQSKSQTQQRAKPQPERSYDRGRTQPDAQPGYERGRTQPDAQPGPKASTFRPPPRTHPEPQARPQGRPEPQAKPQFKKRSSFPGPSTGSGESGRRYTFGQPGPRRSQSCAAKPTMEAVAIEGLKTELARLGRNPSAAERKKQFFKLCLKWHPDKNPENQNQATTVFQFLQSKKDTILK